MTIDKDVAFVEIAVLSGKGYADECLEFVRELHRYTEPGDNLDLLKAAARSGCKTPHACLKWAREMDRELTLDRERREEHRATEEKRAKVQRAKATAKPPADNAA